MTTAQPEGQKRRGYWGGLLVLGAAPINNNTLSVPTSTEATFEAFTSTMPEGKFGGTNAADNSGILRYVRIEFAGFNFVADREFNNLTLCGVGSGTTVDYVQVHGGSDDGIELFGGTVNVRHIVSSQKWRRWLRHRQRLARQCAICRHSECNPRWRERGVQRIRIR